MSLGTWTELWEKPCSKKEPYPSVFILPGLPFYRLAQLVPCSSWGWSTASLCWPAACSSSVAHYCPGAQSGQLLSAQLLVETLGGLVLGSASSFPSPEQQPKQLVLLSFPGYLPSHVVQHILFPTHMAFGQMCSAAQRELRKSSFSPNWWLPAFPSYIPPLNIPFFLPCLCRTEFYQPRAGSALLSSAGSWSQSAPFLLDFAELSKVWSPWAVGIISKG